MQSLGPIGPVFISCRRRTAADGLWRKSYSPRFEWPRIKGYLCLQVAWDQDNVTNNSFINGLHLSVIKLTCTLSAAHKTKIC